MDIKILKNKNFIYKVENNESLTTVANKFNMSSMKLLQDNLISEKHLEKGDILFIQSENFFIYTVKPLDNLQKIAKKFNTSVQEIKDKNKLSNEHIFIGQILIL